MRHCWFKTLVVSAVIGLGLSACQSTTATRHLDFQLDNGKTQTFDFTKRGALPADDGVYKVEALGLMVYQHEQTKQIYYAWDVMVNTKAKAPKKITLSQVLNDGKVQILLEDSEPSLEKGQQWRHLKNGARVNVQAARWRAISAGNDMVSAKWLADDQQDAMFVFKLEIEAEDGAQHVLYQPMVVSVESKQQYLQVLKKALSK